MLGLYGRELATVVAWESSVAVTIGAIVGVPLGIVVGRLLWELFASGSTPCLLRACPCWMSLRSRLGALVLANIMAIIPGRIAARTRTALLLLAE